MLACHTTHPSGTSADSGALSSSSGGGSSASETAVSSGSSSSGGDAPVVLCTEGPSPTWCFERRDLTGGGRLIDLDGDGLDDAIGAGSSGADPPSFTGFLNLGDATFDEAWSFPASFDWVIFQATPRRDDAPGRLFVGSFNEVDTPLQVYTVDASSAQFALDLPLVHSWNFGDYVIFDTNHDDLDDVVAIADGAARMFVLLGTPDGGFSPQPEIEFDDALFGASGVAVGDVDGDGQIDLLTSREGIASPTVYFGDGTGGFPEVVDVQSEGRWPAFVVDFDGDGRGDILTPDAYGFSVVYSEPERTFRVVEQGRGVGPISNTETFFFTPVDLDHDGQVEIVGFQDDLVSSDGTTSHSEARLHVWSDLGHDGFATDRAFLFEDSCDRQYETFDAPSRPAELDGDGEPDLLFGWGTFCPEDFTYTSLGLLYRPQ
jgi:FG-GAP-like repeat